MSSYSFAPIDVGFDLRVQEIPVILPDDATAVTFNSNGELNVVEGDRDVLARALYDAGYNVYGYVVVETMPLFLRESHRRANNWGVYPLNGSVRTLVSEEEASDIIEHDIDGYAHVVEKCRQG